MNDEFKYSNNLSHSFIVNLVIPVIQVNFVIFVIMAKLLIVVNLMILLILLIQ